MAQYPQGIFQSLDWLLKKVKILALDKQPVYNMGTVGANTTYTMVGRGFYYGSSTNAGTSVLQFPNPALCSGQTIVVNNTSGTIAFAVSSTYQPKNVSGGVSSIGGNYTAVFYSNGINWIGGFIS